MNGSMPLKTQLAIEHLIRTAYDEKVTVAGFAFSTDPLFVTNFGNCNDSGRIELFEELCRVRDEKTKAGQVTRITVGKVM